MVVLSSWLMLRSQGEAPSDEGSAHRTGSGEEIKSEESHIGLVKVFVCADHRELEVHWDAIDGLQKLQECAAQRDGMAPGRGLLPNVKNLPR